MKAGWTSKLILATVLGLMAPLAAADDAASARTIAGILNGLNHFPSDSDKAALMAIVNDASSSEAYKTVARAVHNIQHSATADDKAALEAIAGSDADDTAKALAEIVLGISHVPNDAAKARLAAML
jgi:hypothetical protein